MTNNPDKLLLKNGEPLSLITIDGVKDWLAKGIRFHCDYDLIGFTQDGKPRYRCIYVLPDADKPFVLVTTRIGKHGPEVRLFNIWPGLFKHHHEFGDGRMICFDGSFGLALAQVD
ncbi:hypothetical protein SAMN05444149_1049 [Pseudosulfitobacter pseudonitzschiae]|uniref:Uncharacterized protein n=1 Tax=Pseudosulfitobacter pseudonitzschiae TaxID=1402135 RepID=A0A073J2N0_9RHOB|nr:hypothetical protein [Pseudosulfitobacter pseudonitzschiae]KEJ96868.1 hypothetical protein SUH3_08820 [Pseudosulfitobacter pseudonitzschiae]QKS07206.1 hypothetical protein HT745_01255 [Pseudosulfitobacter pseudonitzschiae]SHF45221.1 hypothetical protein SAMN05444149_1049 [Pseudosulfitobacter pseudonitzschiae]